MPPPGTSGVSHSNSCRMTSRQLSRTRKHGSIDPRNDELLFSEGKTYARLGKFEDAVRIFDLALGVSPDRGEFFYEKGLALSALGRHGEAESVLEKAVLHLPKNPDPLYHRGLSLMNLGTVF